MSNAIDCSNLFNLPDPADVVVTEATGHWAARGKYVVLNTKYDQVQWCSDDRADCEVMLTSYLKNGI